MTISATYDDTEELGRVRVTFSGYATHADYALVERSTNGITWTTVRGGAQSPLLAGAGHLDDYEFKPGVLNTYRVSAVNTEPMSVTSGNNATGNNTSLTPALPAGLQKGDLVMAQSTIRNSGTGVPNLPAGWTTIQLAGNVLICARPWVSGMTAPTFTYTGGVANADTIATNWFVRNANLTPFNVPTALLNGSTQNVSTPLVSFQAGNFVIRWGWKQDDFSGWSMPGYATVAGAQFSTAGDDAGQFAIGKLMSTTGSEGALDFAVTGGAAAISRGGAFSLSQLPFTDQETTTVTPGVSRYRIKNPQRPALNRYVEPLPLSGGITRPSRTGVFEVLSRTLPVVVSDVQGSRRFTLQIDVFGYAQKDAMDQVLATGEPMYLETPAGASQLPTLYFVAGDVDVEEDTNGSGSYTFTIPVIECAAPAASVAGDTYTYADVLADFATYADVLAGVASYAALLDKVSTSEVVVP